jgi:signal transduction histidine kinase
VAHRSTIVTREREEMQRQLQQAAKMEAIGRLAGGIAHDFNNILGAILGYGELAQNNLSEGSVVRRQIDQMMQAVGRGKELVDRILAFSRSGMGVRVPLHVQSIVEETLELLAASLPANVKRTRAGCRGYRCASQTARPPRYRGTGCACAACRQPLVS